jgi:hypothetical protein
LLGLATGLGSISTDAVAATSTGTTAFARHVGDGGGTMTGKRWANSGSIIALIGSVLRSLAAISIADPTAPAPIINLIVRAIYSIRSTVMLWAT